MNLAGDLMASIARTLAHDGEGVEDKLQLVVVEGDAVTVHDLPDRGSLIVGRDPDVDVLLTDPSASARHATLYVEAGRVAIEDLASRNGTQVRGQRITPEARVALAPGEAAMLAGAVLVVQRQNRRLQHRRSLPHGYFELRLAEECELAGDGNGKAVFSLARLDVDRAVAVDAFVEATGELLRSSDIVGTYAPNAFEILLRRTKPEEAERALEPLLNKLGQLGGKPRWALAHFPGDGQTAHALLEKACAGVRPPVVGAARPGVIIADQRMRALYRLAERASAAMINVLIVGETGVGKEILAETIHRGSNRASQPFLCLNCAALTESLLESELFGHERGAFTDAKTAKAGLLETANGGTVFLDEIGEMSPSLQAKLLRVIETKQVTRVGGLRPTTIDVRFIAATNRDLVTEIREKRFRSDLYYRLDGLGMEIPPLRERRDEIRPLAEAFLAGAAKQWGIERRPRVGDAALGLLESHRWEGNIRELRNVMERALLLSQGADIEPEHLSTETFSRQPRDERAPVGVSLVEVREAPDARWTPQQAAERARVVDALNAEIGNQTRAARRLGISRATLVNRLRFFDIPRPRKRGP